MKASITLHSAAYLCALAVALVAAEESKRQYLEAGLGQRFDVTKRSVPLDEIKEGGPPKDGIPALFDPKFATAKEAKKFLHDSDIVIGVYENGVAKAYPVRILNWHEIVNDSFAGKPVAVSW